MKELSELQGQIERITYTNEKNGFTVAKLKVHASPDLITIVGNLLATSPGEILTIQGIWGSHPKYGQQFKVDSYKTDVPATVYGIQKYIGSGLIKGIGPEMAKRIVKRFKEQTLEIIENDINQLLQIEGIGEKRIEIIEKAWSEQREIRDVMLFLQSHGISSGYAVKIFKQYGDLSVKVVKENPYRLATDIYGIGFVTADSIAIKLGFPKDSNQRIQAGIVYILHRLSDEGHVYYPFDLLVEKSKEVLAVGDDLIVPVLHTLHADKSVMITELRTCSESENTQITAVYLTKHYVCETSIARKMRLLGSIPNQLQYFDADNAIEWVQNELGMTLAENQKMALKYALENKILVITGGPGTGKTTIINALLKIIARLNIKIKLAAPTGRAAKRMAESTGFESKTIHRLLEVDFQTGGFKKNSETPIACDMLIIDEASMIDNVLMHHLMKAIPPQASFILVGDVNQLPSVGAGNILGDIINSNVIPVVRLDKIFRQAKESKIIVNAHSINQGDIPDLSPQEDLTDFYFIEQKEPEKVLDLIIQIVKERIPKRFGLDPVDDIQVLSPMHKGVVGAENLNKELQNALNPEKLKVSRGSINFLLHDKVMQIKNNYEKEVFNGDIGRIIRIDQEEHDVVISYDGRRVFYDFSELDEIVLAYAATVHKSQGSEYQAVVVPILTQHYLLLQRNLIYTAVTRGKKLVVLVGTHKAMTIGIKNDKTKKRFTNLDQMLAINAKPSNLFL